MNIFTCRNTSLKLVNYTYTDSLEETAEIKISHALKSESLMKIFYYKL
jgi:hypothetical protein